MLQENKEVPTTYAEYVDACKKEKVKPLPEREWVKWNLMVWRIANDIDRIGL